MIFKNFKMIKMLNIFKINENYINIKIIDELNFNQYILYYSYKYLIFGSMMIENIFYYF